MIHPKTDASKMPKGVKGLVHTMQLRPTQYQFRSLVETAWIQEKKVQH